MSQAGLHEWTMASFLAWEAEQPTRWEFDGCQPVAMTGGTVAHELIQGNVIRALNNRLAGGPCRAIGPNLKIRTDKTIRYPDAAVTCSPLVGSDLFFPDPVVVFEVLSDSTAKADRTRKLSEYRAIPTVRRCILLEQDSMFATVIARGDAGWEHTLIGPGSTLALPEIAVELPLAELYDGLTVDTLSTPEAR